jgi:hypothetical protein
MRTEKEAIKRLIESVAPDEKLSPVARILKRFRWFTDRPAHLQQAKSSDRTDSGKPREGE